MTKDQRRTLAHKHHELMLEKYPPEDYGCEIYRGFQDIDYSYFHAREAPINIEIAPYDIITTLFKYHKNPKYFSMVLNFASFTHPGGGFLNGANAQEECLCMFSNLYEVLSLQEDFYEYNKKHTHHGEYEDRAIVSRNIPFTLYFDKIHIDVLTCAAPNLSYMESDSWNNDQALKSRIRFILDIAEFEAIDTLFLGAWGCGVFKQDATKVASLFKELLTNDKTYNFTKVIFAIPPSENLDKFKEVFNDCRRID